MIVSWRGLNELLEKGGEPPLIQYAKNGIISNTGSKRRLLDGRIDKRLPEIRPKTASSQDLFQKDLLMDSQILESLGHPRKQYSGKQNLF